MISRYTSRPNIRMPLGESSVSFASRSVNSACRRVLSHKAINPVAFVFSSCPSLVETTPLMIPRDKPAHGVRIDRDRPTIVYLTICTRNRRPWLATEENHRFLRDVWEQSRAWRVGRYVLMPDHLHLFAALGEPVAHAPYPFPFDPWVRYWKSLFSKFKGDPTCRWQTDHWDTRLRDDESYEEKWWYVHNNPVRAGLVSEPDKWLFQGELNRLEW